jgi:hypothetical protein
LEGADNLHSYRGCTDVQALGAFFDEQIADAR